MGSEYLTKLLSKHLESVIRARIPSITSLINKSIDELKSEMDHLGRPIAVDAGIPQRLVDTIAIKQQLLSQFGQFQHRVKDLEDGGGNEFPSVGTYQCSIILGSPRSYPQRAGLQDLNVLL